MSKELNDPDETKIELVAAALMQGTSVTVGVDDPNGASIDLIGYLRENYGAECSRESCIVAATFLDGTEAVAEFKRK